MLFADISNNNLNLFLSTQSETKRDNHESKTVHFFLSMEQEFYTSGHNLAAFFHIMTCIFKMYISIAIYSQNQICHTIVSFSTDFAL